MTHYCQETNRIHSAKALSYCPFLYPARSAIQVKARTNLRAGAGGVGGLVAVSIDGDYYFPGYDNNGNVVGYWNEDGDLVAEYAYDAFGNIIVESGSMADFFPHRFSTKYYDAETDLYYYGYRYYSPSFGRWISRDPIGERGGNNQYAFCNNRPLFCVDRKGAIAIVLNCAAEEDVFTDKSSVSFAGTAAIIRYMKGKLKTVTDDQFNNAVARGDVYFNGEEFKETKSIYLSRIERESESLFLNAKKYSFKQAKSKLRELVPRANQSWDEVGIVFHGRLETEFTEFGSIGVPYSTFNDWTEEIHAADAIEELRGIGRAVSGKFYIISCFRTYDEEAYPYPYQERLGLEQAKGDVCGADGKNPTDIDYVGSIWFNPVKIKREMFQEEGDPVTFGGHETYEH